MSPRPPCITLFPYTTLFRSSSGFGYGSSMLRHGSRHSARVALHALTNPRLYRFVSGAPSISRSHDRAAEFATRSEEHTSELQSRLHLVCRLLLEKKKKNITY